MEKIAIFTGAGISAESGLDTFRDNNGLWNNFAIEDVATPQAFDANPQLVLDFYNMRQRDALAAQPNAAHLAIAKLQDKFDVTVITQNVDNLHERAGSKKVVHLHGMLDQARSSIDESLVYPLNGEPITLGQECELGSQLRPNIVWFGEYTQNLEYSAETIAIADKILVIGTSLAVYPAAGLVDLAPPTSEKYLITKAIDTVPANYNFLQGLAAQLTPTLINQWLEA